MFSLSSQSAIFGKTIHEIKNLTDKEFVISGCFNDSEH